MNASSDKDTPEGDVFLTFSVVTALVGPPNDPTIGVSHETVARLVMSKRMAIALRDLLNKHVPAESASEGPEQPSPEFEVVVDDLEGDSDGD